MRQDFLSQLRLHTSSGTGVLFVRTRDVMNTALSIGLYAEASRAPFYLWDAARGWVINQDPVEGNGQGGGDPMSALDNVMNGDSTDLEKFNPRGIYAMVHPHFFVKEKDMHPKLMQMLVLMAHRFPAGQRRLILLMPPHVGLPQELQELVPVLNDLPPDSDKLTAATESFIVSYMQGGGKDIVPHYLPDDVRRVAQAGMGMIMPEFEGSLARAMRALKDKNTKALPELVRRGVLQEKAEMVKRSKALEVLDPVDVSQVGGLERLKAWVDTRISAMDPDSWNDGVDKPKGCALVGPPGSGKSLCGKVIGSVLGVATIRFDISSVFSGLVGSSEENMRAALFMLESLAPCVVLLDEVDKVLSTGAGGDGGTSQKVLGSLLTFMSETTAPIFWVPTLNRTENVPAEFLRAGRLDNVFGVGVPNATERLEILRIHLRKRKINPDTVEGLQDLVKRTERYVGAELESIVSGARLLAYNQDTTVTMEHLLESLSEVRPLSKRMADQFAAMENWCKDNATPASLPYVEPTIELSTRQRQRVRNLN